MKGDRALSAEEVEKIKYYFNHREDPNSIRDYTLFFLGLYSGFRIAELLSIKVSDVYCYGRVTDDVYLKRKNTKKKIEGRVGVLNDRCKTLLKDYIDHYGLVGRLANEPELPLFPSRKGGSIKPRQAHNIFKKVFRDLEMTGKLACHTTRKTFASVVYQQLDRNPVDLQVAMGHKNISSTVSYISSDNKKIKSVLENLEF